MEDVVRIVFRAPRLLETRAMARLQTVLLCASVFAVLLLLALLDVDRAVVRQVEELVPSIGGALVGVVAASVVAGWASLRRKPADIEIRTDHIRLPMHEESTRGVMVPFEALLTVDEPGPHARRTLVIASELGTFRYKRSAIAAADAVLLRQTILERLGKKKSGQLVLSSMAARERLAKEGGLISPLCIQALMAASVLMFALSWHAGVLHSTFGLVRMGANAPILVHDKQIFRLLSAAHLHVNLFHLALNLVCLWVLGSHLERLLGHTRLCIIALFGALGGAIATAWGGGVSYSVGATTTVYALLGADLLLHLRYRPLLPGMHRLSSRWWVWIVLAHGLLSTGLGYVDGAGHLGAWLVGAAVTWMLVDGQWPLHPRVHLGGGVRALALLLSALNAAGLLLALMHEPEAADDGLRVAKGYVSRNARDAWPMNNLAWEIAVDKDSNHAWLELAHEAITNALMEEPSKPALLDTMATVLWRLGRVDDAIATERKLVDDGDDSARFYASQVARFEQARIQDGAAPLLNLKSPATPPVITLEEEGVPRAALVKNAPPKGTLVYAVLRHQGVTAGLLRFCSTGAASALRPTGNVWNDLPDAQFITVILDDSTENVCTLKNSTAWNYFPMDPGALQLP